MDYNRDLEEKKLDKLDSIDRRLKAIISNLNFIGITLIIIAIVFFFM